MKTPADVSAPLHDGSRATIKRRRWGFRGDGLKRHPVRLLLFFFVFFLCVLSPAVALADPSVQITGSVDFDGYSSSSWHVHANGEVVIRVYGVPSEWTYIQAGLTSYKRTSGWHQPSSGHTGSGSITFASSKSNWTDEGGGVYSKTYANDAQVGWLYECTNSYADAEAAFGLGDLVVYDGATTWFLPAAEYVPFVATLTGYRSPLGIGLQGVFYGHDLQTDGSLWVRRADEDGDWTEVVINTHLSSPLEGCSVTAWPTMAVGLYDVYYEDAYGQTDPIEIEVMSEEAANNYGSAEEGTGLLGGIKNLFVPNSEECITALDSLKEAGETRFPFSVLVLLDGLADGFSSYYAGVEDFEELENQGISFWLDAAYPEYGAFVGAHPAGDAETEIDPPSWWDNFHLFLKGMIWFGFIVGMYFRFMPKLQITG